MKGLLSGRGITTEELYWLDDEYYGFYWPDVMKFRVEVWTCSYVQEGNRG